MAPKKKTRTAQEARTSSEAPQQAPQCSCTSTTIRNSGNIPHHLGLINPEHIVNIML